MSGEHRMVNNLAGYVKKIVLSYELYNKGRRRIDVTSKFVTAKSKTKVLLQYVRDYEIRDPLTLGIVFGLWSELEVMEKAVFLDDLTYITDEPLLLLSCDTTKVPSVLTYNREVYMDQNEIFSVIQSLDHYYLYLVFPDRVSPYWYLNICEPNPFVRAIPAIEEMLDDIGEQDHYHGDFLEIYKEALMIIINGALEAGDRKQFMALSEEWKKLAA